MKRQNRFNCRCSEPSYVQQSLQHTESHVPHALSSSRRISINQHVAKLLDFVKAMKNPFTVIAEVYDPLNHWLTGIKVNEAVTERLLKVRENGEKHI